MDIDIRDECVALSFKRIRARLEWLWLSVCILWVEMNWPVVDTYNWSHSLDAKKPYRNRQ
jgi:hypothetical protein